MKEVYPISPLSSRRETFLQSTLKSFAKLFSSPFLDGSFSSLVRRSTRSTRTPRSDCCDMTKDDYKKRLVIFFSEKLDADKNGYISWADHELLALRATFQQNNGSFNEVIHKKFLTHSRLMWESLCSDVGVDKDGKVHFDDLVNFMFAKTSNTNTFSELPDFLQNLSIEVFHMIDKKGDNVWDLDEYRLGAVLWCYVTNLREIDGAFNSMLNTQDKSRGGISLARFQELVVEFFTSMDPDTPSRNIFGPLDPNMAEEVLKRAAQSN